MVSKQAFSDSLFLRMEPDLMEALAAEAKARGTEANKSTVARELLRDGLFKKKSKRKATSKKSERDKIVPQVYALWNEVAPKGITRPRARSEKRDGAIMARYAECSDLGKWQSAMAVMFNANRGFYVGVNDRGWKADIDYFVQPSSFSKWVDAAEKFEAAGGATEEFIAMLRKLREEESNEPG